MALIFGLLALLGLLMISVYALSGAAWMGIMFGGAELLVAWRVTPPSGARPLRSITALFGAVTVMWAVLRLFVS